MANGTIAASQLEMLSQSGTGIITITPPATNTNRAITLPDAAGAIVVSGTTPSLNGVTFPATQSASADANTLDDYEEGTWTATFFDAVTGGNQSPTTVTGSYTKIGDMVFFAFGLDSASTSGMTGANEVWFTLPFASSSTTVKNNCAMVNALIQGLDWGGAQTDVSSFLGTASGRFRFYVQGDGLGYASLKVSEISSGLGRFYVSGMYRV